MNFLKYELNKGGVYFCLILFPLSFMSCDNDDDNGTSDPISQQDRDFVKDAGYANRAEIEMGQLALSKSEHDDIIDFANKMIADHTNAQNRLKDLADKKNIPMPDTLDAAHKAMKETLSALDGYQFDSAYISSQVTDHEKAERIFKDGDDKNDDDELENYAEEILHHIREHLDWARQLKEEILNNEPA